MQLLFFYFLEWEMSSWRGELRFSIEEACLLFGQLFHQKRGLQAWAYEIRKRGLELAAEKKEVRAPPSRRELQPPHLELDDEAPALNNATSAYLHCLRTHSSSPEFVEDRAVPGGIPARKVPLWGWSLAEWHLEAAVVALWGETHRDHTHPFLCHLLRTQTRHLVLTTSPFEWFERYVRILHSDEGGLQRCACLPLPVKVGEYEVHSAAVHGAALAATDKEVVSGAAHTSLCSEEHLEKRTLLFFLHLQKQDPHHLKWTVPPSRLMRRLFLNANRKAVSQ